MSPEVIGGRLKKARESTGLSVEEAARLAGINLDKLIAMETGNSDYEITEIEKLSKLYGCSIEYLAGLSDDEIVPAEEEIKSAGWEILSWSNQLLSNIQELKYLSEGKTGN